MKAELGDLARLALAVAVLLAGCRQDMHDQPRYEPLEASAFFDDGRSARHQVEGTIARGHLHRDRHFYEGLVDRELAESFPFPIDEEVLERGREQFNVFCRPCHDGLGTGNGIVVQRGFTRPTSFHDERLRQERVGHFFDVITNGFGSMTSYRDRVAPRDRWAIAAYIRALQLSQNARLEDVPPDERARLEER